jgi:hypothetical protein
MTSGTVEVDAFLADAIDNPTGKLYALGIGWNSIAATHLPTIHPRMAIGLLFRVPYTQTNQNHAFEVSLIDSDGAAQAMSPGGEAPPGAQEAPTRIQGNFNIGRPPTIEPGDEQLIALSVQLDGLLLPKADLYSFVISVDGSELKRLSFRVQQAPPASG